MKTCPAPPPEWISGHEGRTPKSPPSSKPHLAFLPLPHVGREYAGGRLLGVALAIPQISSDEQHRCLSSLLFRADGYLARVRLTFGRAGDWDVILDDREDRPQSLRPDTWTSAGWSRPANRWATVTPVVLDRYPKAQGDAEQTIRQACQRVGLPEPVNVVTTESPCSWECPTPGVSHLSSPVPTEATGSTRMP